LTAEREGLVTATIDGIEVTVPKGTLIIRAAEQLGIAIPRFCDHPLLEPAGACRQCLVEVPDMGNGRGMPKPPPSCTLELLPGMVVKTQLTSPLADKAQQGVMEQLLINHPLDCPMCDKGGECPLQNQSMSNGRAQTRFRDVKRSWRKPIAISANILLDRDRCISCLRCVRFADEIAGDPLIGMFDRGWRQEISTSDDVPFDSYFSGNTVQICPVGALTGATYRFQARPFDLESTQTVCEHCACGCELRSDWRRGGITRRLAGSDPDVNEEWNCDKGRFAFLYAVQRDRLYTPLVRDASGALVETDWPEALERAASGLARAREGGGVGVLPGGRLTEEDAYAYSKFARVVLGTNDIDYRARPHSDEELAFLGAHVAGITPAHVSYRDVEAAPTVLLVGFEPEDEAPIVFLRLRKSARRRRTRVWSVAALASRGLAKLAGTLIETAPGGEASALAGIDPAVREALLQPGALILAGERLAGMPGALTAVTALAAATAARLAWIPRRAGELGAIDAGALPALLPGGRPVSDEDARTEVGRAWGVGIPPQPGRDLTGILAAARHGELDGLLIGGVDPMDLPDPALALEALDRVGFVVSLDLRASAVTERADVVLPVAPAAEKAGHYVTWEGRRRPFDVTLHGTGAMPDARVLDALADQVDIDLGAAHGCRGSRRTVAARLGRCAAGRPGRPGGAGAETGSGRAGHPRHLAGVTRQRADERRRAPSGRHRRGARALLSAATARAVGVVDGASIAVSTEHGTITVPAVVTDVADGVVWLPTHARGCAVRATLGANAGDRVTLGLPTDPAPESFSGRRAP
jgi:NADH-quinone oxidoreductase subunit G